MPEKFVVYSAMAIPDKAGKKVKESESMGVFKCLRNQATKHLSDLQPDIPCITLQEV